jgi:hypothetical protein
MSKKLSEDGKRVKSLIAQLRLVRSRIWNRSRRRSGARLHSIDMRSYEIKHHLRTLELLFDEMLTFESQEKAAKRKMMTAGRNRLRDK